MDVCGASWNRCHGPRVVRVSPYCPHLCICWYICIYIRICNPPQINQITTFRFGRWRTNTLGGLPPQFHHLIIVYLKMDAHISRLFIFFVNTAMTNSTAPKTAQLSKNSGEFDILGIPYQMLLIPWAYSLISKMPQVHFCHNHHRSVLLNVWPSTDLRGVSGSVSWFTT